MVSWVPWSASSLLAARLHGSQTQTRRSAAGAFPPTSFAICSSVYPCPAGHRRTFRVGERAVAVPSLLGLHEPETYAIRILAATVSDPEESFDETPITGILTTSPGVAFDLTETTILILVDAPTASSSG